MGRKSKKKSRKKEEDYYFGGLSNATKRGLWILAMFGLVILMLFSFLGYAGVVGEWLNVMLSVGFGWVRVGLPFVILGIVYYLIKSELFYVPISKYLGIFLLFIGFSGLFHIFIPPAEMQVAAGDGMGGGYLGFFVAFFLDRFLGFGVTLFVLFAFILAGFLIFFNIPLSTIFIGSEDKPSALARLWQKWKDEQEALMAEEEEEEEDDYEEEEEEVVDDEEYEQEEEEAEEEKKEVVQSEEGEEDEEIILKPARRRRRVKIPLDLLDDRKSESNAGNVDNNQEIIRRTLENFGIEVEMAEINVGPTVTQYTMKPAEGIKLTKILALSNDLALALAAHPIRIEAPIPGKSLIGLEVPNRVNALIGLKQLLMSRGYKKGKHKGNLVLPLGIDVAGKSYTVCLDRLPHLLIAGATGSGKSVFINSMILSLLYQHGPDDLKFIMVDPKRVELSVYNRIPHLLTPVITDIKKTINALKWLVVEMDSRYDTLAQKGKRNIADYNQVADEPLPYIVLIIDELADLMITTAAEVESHIIRLAQMARAVGIHLMLATQRPSVDVITGLLKANIPGRLAFSVASAVDSRTILDSLGAEKLVGRGDMLFSSAEVSKPKRIQGAFVSEAEVKRIVSYLADEIGEPEFDEDVVETQQTPTAFKSGNEDGDELFEEAKDIVVRAQKASTSYLQRKLRIGYARAARLMDLLEDVGVVSPQDGSRAREVLIMDVQDDIIESEGGQDFEESEDEEAAEEYEEDDSGDDSDENEDVDEESGS